MNSAASIRPTVVEQSIASWWSASKSVCLVLLLALLVRVGWAAVVRAEPVSDAHVYHLLARQLATGGTYGFDGTPNAFWPVGYPFFLSLHYRLFGEGSWVITLSSIVLSTLTVGLTMAFGCQWFRDRRVAVVTGAVLALYPVYVQFVTITASEILFTFLLLVGLVCWGNRTGLSATRALLTGVCFGVAAYVRPVALGVIAPLALSRWFHRCSLKTILIESCLVLVTVAVVVAPWTYRNYRTYGRFVPVSTNGGMCLFFGNNPLAPDHYEAIIKPDFEGDDAARDAYCTAAAVEFIRTDPAGFLKRAMRKAVRMWERDTISVVWNESGITKAFGDGWIQPIKIVGQGYWVAFLLFAALGMMVCAIRMGWRSVLSYPAVWIVAAFTMVYSATFSQDRYHFPLVALIAPFAAMGMQAAFETWLLKLRKRRIPRFE